MMKPTELIWWVIAVVGVADFGLLAGQGMTVTLHWQAIFEGVFLYSISIIYRRRAPFIASIALSGAQLAALSYAAAFLTYAAMAITRYPMADTALAQADAALGFPWMEWFTFVQAHPGVHFLLAGAYASVPMQALVLITFLSAMDVRRVHELLLSGILAIIIIAPIMALLPAVGAWSQHGVGFEPWRDDIIALRSHTLLRIGEPQGIVSFPSFHAVLGVLFANMARGRKWFVPFLVLNLLMIASVFTEGAHYGVDMISGLAVAVVALAISQGLLARCSSGALADPGDVGIEAGTAFRHGTNFEPIEGTLLTQAAPALSRATLSP